MQTTNTFSSQLSHKTLVGNEEAFFETSYLFFGKYQLEEKLHLRFYRKLHRIWFTCYLDTIENNKHRAIIQRYCKRHFDEAPAQTKTKRLSFSRNTFFPIFIFYDVCEINICIFIKVCRRCKKNKIENTSEY